MGNRTAILFLVIMATFVIVTSKAYAEPVKITWIGKQGRNPILKIESVSPFYVKATEGDVVDGCFISEDDVRCNQGNDYNEKYIELHGSLTRDSSCVRTVAELKDNITGLEKERAGLRDSLLAMKEPVPHAVGAAEQSEILVRGLRDAIRQDVDIPWVPLRSDTAGWFSAYKYGNHLYVKGTSARISDMITEVASGRVVAEERVGSVVFWEIAVGG